MGTQLHGAGEAIDLFAGPGGWDLAASTLGIDPLGIEWDDAACATRAVAGLRTKQADVAALDPTDFAPCDLLIASPPCPSFSTAGKGAGIADMPLVYEAATAAARGKPVPPLPWRDERSALVVEPLRWAVLLEPRFLAWEQVPPVLPFWEHCAELLRRKGWNVWTGIMEVERYGVPQTRERAILIADREQPVHPPRPTHQRYVKGEPQRHEVTLEGEVLPWVSMAEALGWSEGKQPSPAPTVSGGGTAGGGGVEVFAGAHSRRRVAEAVKFRNGNQENAAEREADEPAPTIAFGHNAARVGWVMEKTEDRPERKAQGAGNRPRSLSEPAATIDSRADLSKWTTERPSPTIVTTRRSDKGIVVGRQLPEGEGRNVGGHGWGEDEELAECGCPIGLVDADGFCACCHAHLDDPDGLYALQGDGTHTHRECPQSWPSERPSTSVNGDPRISRPGRHDPEESGSQQKDAIRVSLEEAALLQSFPPDYPFQGTKSQRFLQVGNAVPPLLARAILAALLGVSAQSLDYEQRTVAA